jgi:hypothetical protein
MTKESFVIAYPFVLRANQIQQLELLRRKDDTTGSGVFAERPWRPFVPRLTTRSIGLTGRSGLRGRGGFVRE